MRLGTYLLFEGCPLQGTRPKLADICSAPLADFYAAVDKPQAEGAGMGPPEDHHCYPTSYGFDQNQNTQMNLLRVDNQRLHKLMRKYFQEISNRFANQVDSMDYGPGRTNADIANAVGLDIIKQELEKFYEKFPEFGC